MGLGHNESRTLGLLHSVPVPLYPKSLCAPVPVYRCVPVPLYPKSRCIQVPLCTVVSKSVVPQVPLYPSPIVYRCVSVQLYPKSRCTQVPLCTVVSQSRCTPSPAVSKSHCIPLCPSPVVPQVPTSMSPFCVSDPK